MLAKVDIILTDSTARSMGITTAGSMSVVHKFVLKIHLDLENCLGF